MFLLFEHSLSFKSPLVRDVRLNYRARTWRRTPFSEELSKPKYQKEVTDTLRRNFYVEDLLKSVRDVNTAIYLVHKVIKLCPEGGFQLTNFVSNKVEILQSIPKAKRRDGLKNIDINSGSDLPTERAQAWFQGEPWGQTIQKKRNALNDQKDHFVQHHLSC